MFHRIKEGIESIRYKQHAVKKKADILEKMKQTL